MPKLPTNMVRRPNRPGFHFRRKRDGRVTWIALGEDFEEAKRRLRNLRADGSRPIVHRTVTDAAAEWLKTYVANARSEREQGMTASRIKRYVEPFLGSKLLHRVEPQDLRAFRVWLERTDLKPRSVASILADARCFLRWAEDNGMIDRAPVPKRLLPRVQEQPPDRLTDDEVGKVTRIPDPHGFVTRFALATGLRWGELVRAQSADVQGGAIVVHHTKSRKVRRVPIASWFAPELRSRIGRLVPFVSAGSFNLQVRARSGVERFHVHQCRHTFACRWIEAGGSLAALQQILGHSSVVTTQRYSRIADDMILREAERIEARGVAKGVANGLEARTGNV